MTSWPETLTVHIRGILDCSMAESVFTCDSRPRRNTPTSDAHGRAILGGNNYSTRATWGLSHYGHSCRIARHTLYVALQIRHKIRHAHQSREPLGFNIMLFIKPSTYHSQNETFRVLLNNASQGETENGWGRSLIRVVIENNGNSREWTDGGTPCATRTGRDTSPKRFCFSLLVSRRAFRLLQQASHDEVQWSRPLQGGPTLATPEKRVGWET